MFNLLSPHRALQAVSFGDKEEKKSRREASPDEVIVSVAHRSFYTHRCEFLCKKSMPLIQHLYICDFPVAADSWSFCFSLNSFFSRTAISRLNNCKCFKMRNVCLQFDCLCYMRSLCGCAVSLSLCVTEIGFLLLWWSSLTREQLVEVWQNFGALQSLRRTDQRFRGKGRGGRRTRNKYLVELKGPT